MAVNGPSITDHIIEHEILGIEDSSAGTPIDLSIYDDGSFVMSGINKMNFVGSGFDISNAGGRQVDIGMPDFITTNGVIWHYDSSRSKWLSAHRLVVGAARRGRIKNSYLRSFDGIATDSSGYRLFRDAVITAISVQTRTSETWTLRIRKNDSTSDIASLAVTGASGNHSDTLNVDIDAGDFLQLYAETTAFLGVRDVMVLIELAWRNDVL